MPQHKKTPVVRPSAYPGARLDSSTWRGMLSGVSFKKPTAVVPHASEPQQQTTNPQRTRTTPQLCDVTNSGSAQQHHLTFMQTFGLLGVPVLASVCISIVWTTVLLILNVVPNATANYILDTAEFDDGSFWLIVDPSTSLIAASIVGLGLVLVGYAYALLKMTWWMNADLPDSNSKALVSRLTRVLVREGARHQRVLSFWSDVTGFQGQRRKFWNVWLKAIDIIIQITSLQKILEEGFPAVLCYGYAAAIAINALSCIVMILTPDRHSAFKEVLIDSVFDLFFAVLAPLLVLVYSYYNFAFERERVLLYVEYMNAGSFERQARLMADPAQISLIVTNLNGLVLRTGLDYVLRVGMNLSCCYRLKRVIEVRTRQRRQLLYNHKAPAAATTAAAVGAIASVQPPVQRSVPKSMILPFIIAGAFELAYTSRCIQTSHAACAAYPTCIVFAHRAANDDLCPCLVLIDVDVAPSSYDVWIHSPDVTATVQQLAESGDLQVLQLINRKLETLPDELRACTHLQHLSLMYTGTTHLPTWTREFTTLELLNVEGFPDDTASSLQTLPDDLFNAMSALTYLHIACHPQLEHLPSLDGLVNLKSLSLVLMPSLTALPSLHALHKLERLELLSIEKMAQLPDLSAQTRLVQLIVRHAVACCNGFLGTCDLAGEQCAVDKATCVAGNTSSMTPQTALVLHTFAATVCPTTVPYDATAACAGYVSLQDGAAMCDGVMYRQCAPRNSDSTSSNDAWMCYNSQMRVVACVCTPTVVAIRKIEIAKHLGPTCDPVEEKWLGCE